MSKRGIVQCFLNASLIYGHDGLRDLAKKHKVNVDELEPGEYVVFINSARDRVKVFAASNTIAYLRAEKGSKIDLSVIREIPKVFESTKGIDYDAALKVAVEKAIARKAEASSLQVFRSARAAGVM